MNVRYYVEMTDRLFSLDDVPEVPLLREPRRSRAAIMDGRLDNDYPPEWDKCTTCEGAGYSFDRDVFEFAVGVDVADPAIVKVVLTHTPSGAWTHGVGKSEIAAKSDIRVAEFLRKHAPCEACKGMGSAKARVRLEAGHRCVRCGHPYMPKGDAKMLGVEPSGMHDCATCGGDGLTDPITSCPDCKGAGRVWTPWSACDEKCTHGGPWLFTGDTDAKFTISEPHVRTQMDALTELRLRGADISTWDEALRFGVEAEWRILTVHHLDGDKSNLRWWNLVALDQRCHLEVQARVVMDRVYPHEHSEWFRPYVAGYYAFSYLCKICSRRLDDGPWQAQRPCAYLPGYENVAGPDGYPHVCEPGLEITRTQALDNLDALLGLELAAV